MGVGGGEIYTFIFFSIVRNASTQLRKPATRGMASQMVEYKFNFAHYTADYLKEDWTNVWFCSYQDCGKGHWGQATRI